MTETKVPKSWNEVTIGQYREMISVEQDEGISHIIEKISILTDEDPADIRKWPVNKFRQVSEEIKWSNLPVDTYVLDQFELDGVTYGRIPRLDFILTGEMIDVEQWQKDPIGNMHFYAALMYRPVTHQLPTYYLIEDYKVEGFYERADLFNEKLSITKVNGFFLSCSIFVTQFTIGLADYSTHRLPETKKKLKKTSKKKVTRKPTKKNK